MDKVYFKPISEFILKANEIFKEQKQRINKLLPFADIQHIGSTSIPQSITKGDLDIVVRVPSENFKIAIEELKTLYSINQSENWTYTFASFKDEENFGLDFGVQLVVRGSESDDFVELRNLLLKNSELLEEYNAVKLKHEGKDMEEYRKGKANFFQKLREKLKRNPSSN